MPFKALLENKPFYAWNLTEKYRGTDFKCPDPECNDDLIIVISETITNHFRHKNNESHGVGESLTHLEMKKYFVDLSVGANLKFDIEEYLVYENKVQIADVIIYVENKKYVIECQCSNISGVELKNRTLWYEKYGFTPIWILGPSFKNNVWYGLTSILENIIYDKTGIVFYYENGSLFEYCGHGIIPFKDDPLTKIFLDMCPKNITQRIKKLELENIAILKKRMVRPQPYKTAKYIGEYDRTSYTYYVDVIRCRSANFCMGPAKSGRCDYIPYTVVSGHTQTKGTFVIL